MEFNKNEPIYIQVINEIKKKIISGEYEKGEKLSSTRELAVDYSINPNTAARIYRELVEQGVCDMKRGLGTFVTEDRSKINNIKREMAQNIINRFIDDMKKIGYEYNDMINIIEEVRDKNGNS